MLRCAHMKRLHSPCGHASHHFLVATQRPLSLLLHNGGVNAADSSGLMTSVPAAAATSLQTTAAVLIDAAWRGRRSSASKRQQSQVFGKQRGADVASQQARLIIEPPPPPPPPLALTSREPSNQPAGITGHLRLSRAPAQLILTLRKRPLHFPVRRW